MVHFLLVGSRTLQKKVVTKESKCILTLILFNLNMQTDLYISPVHKQMKPLFSLHDS